MSIDDAVLEKMKILSSEEKQRVLEFVTTLVRAHTTETAQHDKRWQNNPAIGIWKDREDIKDSAEWVREQRNQEQRY